MIELQRNFAPKLIKINFSDNKSPSKVQRLQAD